MLHVTEFRSGRRRTLLYSICLSDANRKEEQQEEASLRKVDDSFKKIVVLGEDILVRRSDDGITTMSIYDFLLNSDSLDW